MALLTFCSIRVVERARSIDPAWRWAIGVYVAARLLYSLWGVVVLALFPVTLENLDLFGTPVVAWFDLRTSERAVYARVVDGKTLVLSGGADGTMQDAATGSIWTLREGRAVAGALAGAQLHPAEYSAEDIYPYHGVAAETNPLLAVWQRFDVLWYQAIAEKGYGATAGDAHFPPLYPALERIVGLGLGGRYLPAGWLIAQAALVGALALLYRQAARWGDDSLARRSVVLLAIFPTAFFLWAPYSESLCLLFILLTFRALGRREWLWVGAWTGLAILTRLQSVALLAPLAYCAWVEVRAGKGKRHGSQYAFAFGLPLAAGALYLGLRAVVGEGSVVPLSEPGLNARLVMPWENVAYAVVTLAGGKFLLADVLNLAILIGALIVVAIGWRELPREQVLFVLATLVIVSMRHVETQPLNSMARYELMLFPLFLLLGKWSKNPWVARGLVYSFVPLNLYLSAQYMSWGWVA